LAEKKKKYLHHFWKFVKPYKKPLRTVYLLYFINSVLNLVPAFSVRFYIDVILMGQDSSFLGFTFNGVPESTPVQQKVVLSLVFLAAIVVLIIVANTIGVIMWRLGTKSTERVLFDIKIQIHNHINKLSLGYFNNERVGTIMTKAVGDVESLSALLRNSFILVYQVVQVILAPFLMLTLSPALFLVVLIPMPLIIIAFRNIKFKLKPMYRQQRENTSLINSQIQETVSGIKEVKAFNLEETAHKTYSDINWKFYDTQNAIMKVFSFNHQLQYGSKDLGIVLIAVCGGIFFFLGVGNITPGVIASFIALTGFIFNPVQSFLGFYDIIQRGMVSMERIIDFLNVDHDVKDEEGAIPLERDRVVGAVAFRDVSFSYVPGTPILEHVSCQVAAGDKVAVVGPSGSGKSTLLSLLLRFYDVNSGVVEIDGKPINTFTQQSVRENIGIVFQETFLFYGSLRDNFTYVKPDCTEQQMIDACKAANIYDAIQELPHGFDTVVGERGVKLSGGQKQRIAIARVFLKDPAIVILDEATSAVDTVTESLIQSSIDKMLTGRTAFIIAHRLSTIKNCDTIIVLDDKKVAEIGTHVELIEKKGLYFQLHQKNEFASRPSGSGDNEKALS